MRKADLINGVEQVSRALGESGLELPLVEVARLGYRSEVQGLPLAACLRGSAIAAAAATRAEREA